MKPKHTKQVTDYQIWFSRTNLANSMQNKKKCNGSSTLILWEGKIVAINISLHCYFNTVGLHSTDHAQFIAEATMQAKIPATARTRCVLQNLAYLSTMLVLHKDSQRLGLVSELFSKCKFSESSLGRIRLCPSHVSEPILIYRTHASSCLPWWEEKIKLLPNGKVFRSIPPHPRPTFLYYLNQENEIPLCYI